MSHYCEYCKRKVGTPVFIQSDNLGGVAILHKHCWELLNGNSMSIVRSPKNRTKMYKSKNVRAVF